MFFVLRKKRYIFWEGAGRITSFRGLRAGSRRKVMDLSVVSTKYLVN